MTRLVDHLLVLLLVLVVPVATARGYRAFVRDVQGGDATARLREYRHTLVLEWSLCLIVMVWWWLAARSPAALGLVLPDGARTLAGLGITVLVLALMVRQWRTIGRLEGAALDPLRAQMASVIDLIPHTETEFRWVQRVAVTAGICEEVLYRGFLIWYLQHFVPGWAAAIAGGAVFGLGHWYQGAAGVVKTGITGVLAGLLFTGTGSLLWPIILHTAVDLQGGAIGRRLVTPVG